MSDCDHSHPFSPPKSETINKSYMCKYCNRQLSTKYTLKTHQLTAKICKRLQNKENDPQKFNCKFCGYTTDLKGNLKIHMKNCKYKTPEEMEKKIDELGERLKLEINEKNEYKNRIIEEAFKPKINNTNTQQIITLNMQIQHSEKLLSPYEEVKKQFGFLIYTYFGEKEFKNGIPALCSIINKHLLSYDNKKWLICYQDNKSAFHKKTDSKILIDNKAEQFLDDIFPYIQKVAGDHFYSIKDNIGEKKARKIFEEFKQLEIPESKQRIDCINSISANNSIFDSDVLVIDN